MPPNSIDIGKGINVMRGHVDANGSIALHEGPAEQGYVLYVISGTGKMTLNDKDGKQYGEVTYKPDDILLFHPHTCTAGSTATSRSNSSASTCRSPKVSNVNLRTREGGSKVALSRDDRT